jgi:glycosyltransferase involved in cell wall biosynthesis
LSQLEAPLDAAAQDVDMAIGRIAPRHPDLRMIFLGGGEAQAEVEAAVARLGLSDRVELRGWTGNDEVRDLLGRARALVLPSLAEGLPIVIMEALALERPALTTWVAGIPELVDEGCGWLIPRGSVDHIAQALEAALEADPDTLARKGAEGRRRVAGAHDQSRNARALHALIAAQTRAG